MKRCDFLKAGLGGIAPAATGDTSEGYCQEFYVDDEEGNRLTRTATKRRDDS